MTTGRLKSTRKTPSCQALACQASLTLVTLIASTSDNRGYYGDCHNLGTPRLSIVMFLNRLLYCCFPSRPLSPMRPAPHRGTRAGVARCTISISLRGSERSAQHLDGANLGLRPFHLRPELFCGHGSDEFLIIGVLRHRFVTDSRTAQTGLYQGNVVW
jgi:hypothetical protein